MIPQIFPAVCCAPFHGDGFSKPWKHSSFSDDSSRSFRKPWQKDGADGSFEPRKPRFNKFGGAKPWERKGDEGDFAPRREGFSSSKPWERKGDEGFAPRKPRFNKFGGAKPWERKGDEGDFAPRRESFSSSKPWERKRDEGFSPKPWEQKGDAGDFAPRKPRFNKFGGAPKPWERKSDEGDFSRSEGFRKSGSKPFHSAASRFGTAAKKHTTAAIPSEGEIIFGRQPVREVLRAGRRPVKLLVLADGVKESDEVSDIRRICEEKGIPLEFFHREDLEAWVNGANHQGVVAFCEDYPYAELDELVTDIANGPKDNVVVVLDHIVDPQNLGSILRTCECAGVAGVVLPTDRAVGVTPAAVRASTGASEHLKIARISNLVTALDRFKEAGAWITGLEALAESKPYTQVDYKGKVCLVIGSEAHGICSPVRKKCDFLVRLPMRGAINSLNAGVATALALYEVLRQHGATETKAPAGFIGENTETLPSAAEMDSAETAEAESADAGTSGCTEGAAEQE